MSDEESSPCLSSKADNELQCSFEELHKLKIRCFHTVCDTSVFTQTLAVRTEVIN